MPSSSEAAEATPHPPQQALTIAAIGASAGALEALKRFFSLMPKDERIAFVVIVHLAPHHPSAMAELLTGSTAMPVSQVREGDRVRPGHVYIIPPNHAMRIEKGVLHLEEAVTRPSVPMPIDRFMISLAEDQQTNAVGIVLTGADHDGTRGLKEIKIAGGFTIAQDPGTAQHAGMPRSAIAAQPDLVLPIERMPDALINFVDHAALPLVQREESPPPEPAPAEPLREPLAIVRARTGYDFRGYRPGMLERRVRRRIALRQAPGMDAYLKLLRDSEDEAHALARDCLIGVTEFFREPEAWRVLEETVVPVLQREKPEDAHIRVWSAGCSSGEEAYSAAMMLLERFSAQEPSRYVTVFATDIDTEALQMARTGRYPTNIEAMVAPERLARFFRKVEDHYEVRKELRESVLFARQNLIADPPFSRLDLIICRNLLIYLEPALQQKIIQLFHFALNPGGFLFLGKSESLGTQAGQFEPVSKQWRIYRRLGMPGRLPRDLPSTLDTMPPGTPGAKPVENRLPEPAELVRGLLLDGHAPAAVLVNRDYRVLYFHGRTDLYLAPPGGEPIWDLPALVRDGLRIKLRAALHLAISEARAVSTTASMKRDGGRTEVRIAVEPVKDFRNSGMLLVTFQDQPRTTTEAPAGAPAAFDESVAVHQLELELSNTKRELQSVVEDLESANEELRVGNEEAMSMNEELQTSNEELQTSKEELQSLNEELTTVNAQLEAKLDELQRTHDDLSNLLASAEIPTLFLDRDFCIKRFTPSATRLFSLIPSDLNRPLSDISSRVPVAALLADARRVFDSLVPGEEEIETDAGDAYLRRILPYRTEENRIEGVVVTFTDITALRHATERLRRFATVLRDSNDAIVMRDFDGRILEWNRGAERIYGYREDAALKMDFSALVPEALSAMETAVAARARAGEAIAPYDTRRATQRGELIDVSVTVSALRNERGEATALVSTEREITERKRMEVTLRESEARFRAMADNMPALIWTDDAQRRLQYVNRGFLEYTGRRPDAVLGDNWLQFVHPDDIGPYSHNHEQAVSRRLPFEAEFRMRRADEQYRWVRAAGVPRFREDGEFIGYAGLTLDIHERKLAEQSLAEADQHKNEFLAMLAHELRNPLAPIRTTVEVLKRIESSDPKIAWVAGIIERQTHQLSSLVDDLLDVARISRGKIVLKREPLELAIVVERARETSQPLIDARRHTLNIKLPPEPLYVEGDLLRLAQVISNLLNNAAKFSGERGVIDLSVEPIGDEVAIRVRDNGVGIAPAMLGKVFDLFTQANPTLDRGHGGLGIGLTLVHELVRLHGGSVEAHSAGHGKGSEFVVQLPLLRSVPPVPNDDTPSGMQQRADLRVLVVDDNADARESLSMLLQMAGYQVRTATDGETALEAAAQFRPDVVLLDIGLPGINGYEVARMLRGRPESAHALMIALTGYGQPEDVYRTKAAGFDHHLVKPVDFKTLSTLLTQTQAAGRHR